LGNTFLVRLIKPVVRAQRPERPALDVVWFKIEFAGLLHLSAPIQLGALCVCDSCVTPGVRFF
jgi:hypothetical protein